MKLTKAELKEVVKEAIIELVKSGVLQEMLGSSLDVPKSEKTVPSGMQKGKTVPDKQISSVASGAAKDPVKAKIFENVIRAAVEAAPDEKEVVGEKTSIGPGGAATLEKKLGVDKAHWAKVLAKTRGK